LAHRSSTISIYIKKFLDLPYTMHTCDEMRVCLKKMGVKGMSGLKKAELKKMCKLHGCMDEHGVLHMVIKKKMIQ